VFASGCICRSSNESLVNSLHHPLITIGDSGTISDVTCTVLVVDDDSSLQRVFARFLAQEGFVAATASNGQEALKYLRGGGIADVILLDLRMPVMDGWAFRREQRADPLLASIPVIVLSGADAERVPELEAAAAFEKPASLTDVVTEIRRLRTETETPSIEPI
jgi:CheY-like chemotaxis protein